ncbi:MAG: hypothetical protein JJ939_16045 [Alphaproteobacteria bacterium]|nr:hypothetical protein [Alphaproteobacteria bacterium]MBO6629926.1 hypothetical protein [Alphaproteobacteria bacterium]
MANEMQCEFKYFAQDLMDGPFIGRKLRRSYTIVEMLRRFSEKGNKTLEELSDKRFFDRKPETLKRYCRAHLISFPDYTPRVMKGGKQ